MPNIGRRAFVAGSASAVLAKAVPASAQDFPPGRSRSSSRSRPAAAPPSSSVRSATSSAKRSASRSSSTTAPAPAARSARARSRSPTPTATPSGSATPAPGDRPEPLLQRRLRPAQGLLLDRADRHRAEHAGGASVVSGEVGAGADRLCQGQSRQGQLRLGRHRHRQPRLRRVFRVRDRHQARAHPLQGHRPGADDLIGGHIPMAFAPIPATYSNAKSGTMRMLAVTSLDALDACARDADHRRTGRAGIRGGAALRAGGAGRHARARSSTSSTRRSTPRSPPTRCKKRLALEGAEPVTGTPEQYAADLDKEITLWAKVVKESGAKAD